MLLQPDFFSQIEPQIQLKKAISSLRAFAGVAENDMFIFTRTGIHAIHQVFLTVYFEITRRTGKNHFVVGENSEKAAHSAGKRFEKLGCALSLAPLDIHGKVTLESIAASITPRTALVSLALGDGKTGVVIETEEIAKLCKERGILFHLEASHVLGKRHFSFQESGADLLTFYAPPNSGGLFLREDLSLNPFTLEDEETLDIASLVGCGIAAEDAFDNRDFMTTEIARLKMWFEEELCRIPGVEVLYREDENRLPHITALTAKGVHSEALHFFLQRASLHALFDKAVTFTLSSKTTQAEIEKALEIIVRAIKHLRKYSQKIVPC